MPRATGGGNITDIYPITSDHGTVTTTRAIRLAEKVKSEPTKSGLNVDTVQYDPTIVNFIQDNEPDGTTSEEDEKVMLEDGTEVGGGVSSTSQQFLTATYGPEVTGGKIPITVIVGPLSDDSGDTAYEGKKLVRPKFSIVAVKAEQDITVPNACLDATIVDVPATPFEVPAGKKKMTFFADKAS